VCVHVRVCVDDPGMTCVCVRACVCARACVDARVCACMLCCVCEGGRRKVKGGGRKEEGGSVCVCECDPGMLSVNMYGNSVKGMSPD
jgi:hypothetical protein